MTEEIIGICEDCNTNMIITHRVGTTGHISELKAGVQISWMCPECGHKFVIVCSKP